jgi:hypothetical protein
MTKGSTARGNQHAETPARQWGSSKNEAAERAADYTGMRHAAAVEIPDAGYPLVVTWNIAQGATSLALDDDAGSVSIGPSAVLEPIGALTMTRAGNTLTYGNPQRKRIRSLTLHGLKASGADNPIYKSRNDFATPTKDGKILRLMVSVRASGSDAWMPLFAIPEVGKRGAIPAMFTGASFSNEVLTFPYALTGQFSLTLYEKDKPEEFSEVKCDCETVSATVEIVPVDLELTGPAGDAVWGFPGEYLSSAQAAQPSLRVPIELALKADLPAALAANRALRAEFTLKGKATHEAVFLDFKQPRGAILRERAGLIHCDLQGDPVALPIDAPLDPQAPASVGGGLSVRYLGMRLVPELSDMPPGAGEMVEGTVVRDAAAVRAFPPAGLVGLPVAKIGFIGRAPEECEIEAQLVRVKNGGAAEPIGPPGRLVVAASGAIATAWVDMPEADLTDEALAVTLRALRGRFFWVRDAESDALRVRVVVRDPDPGGRPLLLGGATLLEVGAASIDVVAQSFPPARFRSTIPTLSSDLFLGVDISDLTMRYVRP